jgi:hypothetical protein
MISRSCRSALGVELNVGSRRMNIAEFVAKEATLFMQPARQRSL